MHRKVYVVTSQHQKNMHMRTRNDETSREVFLVVFLQPWLGERYIKWHVFFCAGVKVDERLLG